MKNVNVHLGDAVTRSSNQQFFVVFARNPPFWKISIRLENGKDVNDDETITNIKITNFVMLVTDK